MSETFVGTVAAKSTKELKSGTYYSVCVKGESGEDVWFRTGKKEIPAEKGNKVKFTFNEDKYGMHVDLESLKVKEGEPVASPGASRASASGKGADTMSKADWAAKDHKIGYMAASKVAVPLVVAALQAEFLGIPKSKKPAEKLGLFMEYVREITEEIFRTTEGVPARLDEILAVEEKGVDFDADLEELADEPKEDDTEEEEDW